MPEDNSRRYRALVHAGPGEEPFLHLVREDSETSLCGIPRAQLGSPDGMSPFVCVQCLEWLPKRVAFSGVYPKLPRQR